MRDNRVTRTISVAGSRKPEVKSVSKKDAVDVHFSIPNVSKRYKIGDIIGSGGNSTVVEAYDRDLKRIVAVKLLKSKYHKNERAVQRFLNEASITAMLQHPGVVPVYEVGFVGQNDFFFSMKKVEGVTLRDMLNKDSSEKDLSELLNIFFAICETMAFAHEKGITHRDLKPENIMIEKYGSMLIMDWGLAKDADGSEENYLSGTESNRFDVNESVEVTMNGEISGTPSYMSPEQSLGMMNKMNQRSDVFSLGILLYEIVSGHNPFTKAGHDNFREIFESIKHFKPPVLSRDFRGRKIRKELSAICMKCLEKLPDDRYADGRVLYKDLHCYRENRPVSAFRTGWKEETTKWVERKKKFLIVSALLITSLTLSYFYRKTAEAEISGILTVIERKMVNVVNKQDMVDKLKARFSGQRDKSVANILSSHEEQKRIEWQTAKDLILYLANTRESKVTDRQVEFLKLNWLKEIRYYLDKGFLFEADKSLEELQVNVEQFSGDWEFTTREQEIITTYLRILGKVQGNRHARK
ncbi:MAG: serine/threonine protein kinase [Lentisphaeraceae bacterium]|nr:serine/threonine protein kinase [Lentisphaeraceae bacterium]